MEPRTYTYSAEIMPWIRAVTRVTAPDIVEARKLIEKKIQTARITPEQKKFLLENITVIRTVN